MKIRWATVVLLAAIGGGMQAAEKTRVDVYISDRGENGIPSFVDYGARSTVTWMFARVGVRLVWHDGEPGIGATADSPMVIQIRFDREAHAGVSPEALARALPFGEQGVAIDIMYDRIRFVARRSSREAPILAHVLAHEIGHVLQGTTAHALGGVMKAHWNGQDYDAMEKKPLEFTFLDAEMKDEMGSVAVAGAKH